MSFISDYILSRLGVIGNPPHNDFFILIQRVDFKLCKSCRQKLQRQLVWWKVEGVLSTQWGYFFERGRITGYNEFGLPFICLLGGTQSIYPSCHRFLIWIFILLSSELSWFRKLAYVRGAFMSFFFSSSVLVTFVTFMTYVLTGETLTAQKVFTCLSLFNSVRIVMALFFPIAITLMNEGRVSIERIQVSASLSSVAAKWQSVNGWKLFIQFRCRLKLKR